MLRQPTQNKHRACPHPLFSTMILTMSSKNASSSSNYLDLLELALIGQQHPIVTSPVSHASFNLEPRNASICPRLESDHCSAAHLSNKPHRNVQGGQHPGSSTSINMSWAGKRTLQHPVAESCGHENMAIPTQTTQ